MREGYFPPSGSVLSPSSLGSRLDKLAYNLLSREFYLIFFLSMLIWSSLFALVPLRGLSGATAIGYWPLDKLANNLLCSEMFLGLKGLKAFGDSAICRLCLVVLSPSGSRVLLFGVRSASSLITYYWVSSLY